MSSRLAGCPDRSLLDVDLHDVRAAQAIIEHSRRVYLAADHSEQGRSALVHARLTDRSPPPAMVYCPRPVPG
jgi:DeoR family transcriptional regulator, glycerol-3-phosphate regulon repressor